MVRGAATSLILLLSIMPASASPITSCDLEGHPMADALIHQPLVLLGAIGPALALRNKSKVLAWTLAGTGFIVGGGAFAEGECKDIARLRER
jgi:hypothetical protein